MKIIIECDVEIVDTLSNDAIARCIYPDEPNSKIQIVKGLNIIEFSEAIHHEIGHLFDWYISNGTLSTSSSTREENANVIGDCIRFKERKQL